ncbi:hypothetical protein T08_12706 [Trichinella sp. T8]|nr:hypothetical protein T08_12706 [Trichinella sp. T8]
MASSGVIAADSRLGNWLSRLPGRTADIGTSEKLILAKRNERRRARMLAHMHAVCEEERPNVEQPCANAGHDRGISPAASRRGHPMTAGKDLVRESVRPGPDQLLHQVDGCIPPHQHGSRVGDAGDVPLIQHQEVAILFILPAREWTLLDMLSIMVDVNPRQWDDMLPYNSSVHKSTGLTPAIAIFRRELQLLLYVQIGNPPEQET